MCLRFLSSHSTNCTCMQCLVFGRFICPDRELLVSLLVVTVDLQPAPVHSGSGQICLLCKWDRSRKIVRSYEMNLICHRMLHLTLLNIAFLEIIKELVICKIFLWRNRFKYRLNHTDTDSKAEHYLIYVKKHFSFITVTCERSVSTEFHFSPWSCLYTEDTN